MPAEAGIQNALKTLDSRFHGNDFRSIDDERMIF